MNSLSWLIYAGHIIDSAIFFLGFWWLVIAIIFSITLLKGCIEDCISDFLPLWKKMAIAVLISGSIAIFIPDSKTLYLIAASQAGEKAIKSPDFMLMQEVIQKKLKSYLKDSDA